MAAVEADLFLPFIRKLRDSNILHLTSDAVLDTALIKRCYASLGMAHNYDPICTWASIKLIIETNPQRREYKIMFHRWGDFDERLFLTAPQEVGRPLGSESRMQIIMITTKRAVVAGPLHLPRHSPPVLHLALSLRAHP